MTAENPFLKLNFRPLAYLFVTLLIVCLSGSISASAEHPVDPSAEVAVIRLEGTTVTFAGQISDENVDRFLETVGGAVQIEATGGKTAFRRIRQRCDGPHYRFA